MTIELRYSNDGGSTWAFVQITSGTPDTGAIWTPVDDAENWSDTTEVVYGEGANFAYVGATA